nr:putative membrane protein [Cedratvirus duvanny]
MYDRLLLIRLVTLCVSLPCLIFLTYPIIVRPLIMEVPFLVIGVTLAVYNVLSLLGCCLRNYVNQPNSVKQACTKAFEQTLNSFISAWAMFHLFTVTMLPLVMICASTYLYIDSSLDLSLLLFFYLFSTMLLLLGAILIITLRERARINRKRLEYDTLA